MNNLNGISWHFIKIDSFQDPSSDYFSKISEIDSFQDPCVFHQKLTPFKTLVFYIGIDSFQDPCSDYFSKMSEIDSFQDPCVFTLKLAHFNTHTSNYMSNHRNWLISRPQHCVLNWTHFKTLTFYTQTKLISGPLAVNYLNHHPSNSFQDPHIWKIQCFNLHGKLSSNWQCKISMGDYLQE